MTAAVLDELLGEPGRLDEVVDRLVARIRAEVPEYDAVTDEDLRAGNHRIIAVALAHLRENRLPDPAELRRITEIGAGRAREGVSLAAVLAAYRVAGEDCWELVAALARKRGAGDSELLVTVQLMWRWLDVVTVAAATAHHEVELRVAREDEQRIGESLRALLGGPGSAAASRQHLARLGLDPGGRYAALRGRLAADVTVSVLRESMPSGGVVAAVGREDVLGVLDAGVRLPAGLGTFGLGPVCAPQDLSVSARSAGRALAAASRLGLSGAHELETLRLAAVAATDPDLTRILVDRLLKPLQDKGSYGEDIWRSVVVHLAHRLRVDEAAAASHVHVNTLRRRLAQFSELTGADLHEPGDLAELWWLVRLGLGPGSTSDR
ncbi:PucR family transcriptional regulator [Amycolatopsis sp. H20-H5]|uniref:PucR family transcriptional regulator n=1 Tax=Amycolatopsis sp. H20-H5 TaxID=3046309 RepID=UPI002DBAA306|nr:helix-turn-helix domain-containing protein [Amycolatopsis sp. H20-H5]MEC3976435.1 helix-turn-helix domain-containing protein [Amycolatopsis sp. H20-H5]